MRSYWGTIKRNRLQKWPYEELKLQSNEEIINYCRTTGMEGVVKRVELMQEQERESVYKQAGYMVSCVIWGYFIGWMAIILLCVLVVRIIVKYI